MRRRFFGVPALAATVLCCTVVGCMPKPAMVSSSVAIEALRTDPDHRGLLASYTGGACDGPARLVLTEREARIDAKVMVERHVDGACTDEGIHRTLSARLAQPIGERGIWSSGREYLPFDGAQMLVPSVLPAGFGGVREAPGEWPATPSPAAKVVTRSWATIRFDPAARASDAECATTRGILEVRIGPAGSAQSPTRVKVGTVLIGAATASVYRDAAAGDPGSRIYVWHVGDRRVELSNSSACGTGDRLLSNAELLRVARSLRPA